MLSFVSNYGEDLCVVGVLRFLEQGERAEDLADAHSEGNRSTSLEGRIAVKEFAHRAYTMLLKLFLHADERALDEGDSTATIELEAGLEVRAQEPRPYRAIVVGLLPLPLRAVTLGLVAVTLWAE